MASLRIPVVTRGGRIEQRHAQQEERKQQCRNQQTMKGRTFRAQSHSRPLRVVVSPVFERCLQSGTAPGFRYQVGCARPCLGGARDDGYGRFVGFAAYFQPNGLSIHVAGDHEVVVRQCVAGDVEHHRARIGVAAFAITDRGGMNGSILFQVGR